MPQPPNLGALLQQAQNIQAAAGRIGARPIGDDQQFQFNIQAQGRLITPEVAMRIRRTIGARLTAAHVPAVIADVADLPLPLELEQRTA